MAYAYKNILAAIAPAEGKQPAGDYAISMAATLQARVTGGSYALHPEFRGPAVNWLPGEITDHLHTIVEEAHNAMARFQHKAREANVEVGTEVYKACLETALDTFAEQTRAYDITVVSQPTLLIEHVGDFFSEAALFYSGRPMILVPTYHSDAFSADRILIAWDGSQHAATVVAHAMPLLITAKKVEVLVVGDREKAAESHASKLVQNLERHNIDVELIVREDIDEIFAIKREATAWNASLLVMGGYGHSRMREMIFGGVTKRMFSDPSLPVLMAH